MYADHFDIKFNESIFIENISPIIPLKGNLSLGLFQCGTKLVGSLWLTEISSPFLHIRELLKELGYSDQTLKHML